MLSTGKVFTTTFRRRVLRPFATGRCHLSATAVSQENNSDEVSSSSMFSTVRSTSLGLEKTLVQPHVASISQLPEVAAVLQQQQQSKAVAVVEALERARDIFASFQPAGPEHLAVLALLAEVQQTQLANYTAAEHTVTEIMELLVQTTPTATQKEAREIQSEVALALVKTLWMQGNFQSCVQQTTALKESLDSSNAPLHAAAVENAYLLSTLMHEGPVAARQAALAVDAVGLPTLAQAVVCLNLGIVEALWGLGHDCEGDNTCSTQLDIAKQTWQQGLDLLSQVQGQSSHYLRHALEGRLHSNIAYAILEIAGRHQDHISKASEHARDALQALEQIRSSPDAAKLPDEGWARALSLVAQCYHRAGHAVTAEGLLQSALDETHAAQSSSVLSPSLILERQAAYQAYAALCKDWEKRQGDAARFSAQRRALTDKLHGGWKDATELHSSLWLWTPSMFSYE